MPASLLLTYCATSYLRLELFLRELFFAPLRELLFAPLRELFFALFLPFFAAMVISPSMECGTLDRSPGGSTRRRLVTLERPCRRHTRLRKDA